MRTFFQIVSSLFLIFTCFIVLPACGAGEGRIALKVKNARGPEGIENPSDQVASLQLSDPVAVATLAVTQFRVTISGDGIPSPIVATADGSAKRLDVPGIPIGSDRTVLIEAINSSGKVIRRRSIEGVGIQGGKVTPVQTSLSTVPVFLNLKEGAIISSNFQIVGFGEPGGSINVHSKAGTKSVSLNRSAGGEKTIVSPALSTGIFEFAPTLSCGKQTLTIVDEDTNESTSVTVFVVDDKQQPGMRLVTAGNKSGSLTVGIGADGSDSGHFPSLMKQLTATETVEDKGK